jgi:hypothetical protein
MPVNFDDISPSVSIFSSHKCLGMNVEFEKITSVVTEPEPGAFVCNIGCRLECNRDHPDTFGMS